MIPLIVLQVFLLTTRCFCLQTNVLLQQAKNSSLGYNPNDILAKIFTQNISTEYRQAGHHHITFENVQHVNAPGDNEQGYGFINFEGQSSQDDDQSYNNNLVSFQNQNDTPEDNQKLPTWPHHKRKRRRRRPRLQQLPGFGYGLQHPVANNIQNVPLGQNSYGFPQMPGGQDYRPQYQYKPPSLTEQALTGITRALESVARYDDLQCVPRLLCEAAGGATSENSASRPPILSSLIDIQPIITLLGAYSGVSTSPLFVFGRAVFLGVTSKGNSGVCRYAYPLCPTDAEKLVDYLNNHNGGFFRFFNAPAPAFSPSGFSDQASLQQFYSQLSNAPHRIPISSNQQQIIQSPENLGGNNGFHRPNNAMSLPGLYNNKLQSNYGFPQKYGLNYPYNRDENFRHIVKTKHVRNKDQKKNEKIEKRIQNNPSTLFVNIHQENRGDSYKWTFPEQSSHKRDISEYNFRIGRILKFPEEFTIASRPINAEQNSRTTRFTFPGQQSNRHYTANHSHESVPHFNEFASNIGGDIKYDESGYYVESNDFVDNNDFIDNNDNGNSDAKVVYIVRGNGDPNNPEVVRLLPGQKVI